MKRSISFLLIFSMLFVFLSTSCSKSEEYTAPDVCLDAGHGGEDYGSVYNTRYEKNDNLNMVNAIKRELDKRHIKTVLTRNDDTFVSLQERTRIANESGAKLLVSIHRNSGKNAKGVEIWISSQNIWADRVLAENIMESLEKTGITANRGIKTGFRSDHSKDYYINSKSDLPSCIIEFGFMNNSEDNKMFDENAEEYAESVADAIELTLQDISTD